jgi:uncharacterized protein (TIGR02246 family)
MTDQATDEAAIKALFDVQGEGWRRRDGGLFASAFTPDADFTNITALTMRGRDEIARHHQQLFETVYRDAVVERGELEIRFVRPDVATIQAETRLRVGPVERRAHFLAVAVRCADGWQLAALHNMVPFVPPGS